MRNNFQVYSSTSYTSMDEVIKVDDLFHGMLGLGTLVLFEMVLQR